jgi:chromosome segregation and condensation protein ScpB
MKKKIASREIAEKLTDPELDLLAHIEQGYQLETDSLGAEPVLRKGGEVIRPVSVNRNTIRVLEERGLIKSGKGKEPLTLVWRKTKAQ